MIIERKRDCADENFETDQRERERVNFDGDDLTEFTPAKL